MLLILSFYSSCMDWPIEDEYGRISASDAFKLASRYTSGWSHSIQVVKESHLEHLYLQPHFVAHRPPKKVDVTLSNLDGKSWNKLGFKLLTAKISEYH
ncbi:hypothetical protein Tco_0183242 [Tanacetum coccineum]